MKNEMTKYKIVVLTLNGIRLTFTVSQYKITEGDFVEFYDEIKKEKKRFHASRCEINEEGGIKDA